MLHRHAWAALALAAAALPAYAVDVALPGDNAWHEFLASDLTIDLGWLNDDGDPLHFTFSIGSGLVGTLTVLDTGFAGDTFKVTNFGALLGSTSAVPVQLYDPSATSVADFGVAFADLHFSRATFTLGPGSYSIFGNIDQSVMLDDGERLNATSGGVRLAVTPVPEPSSLALLLAGLGAVGAIARRRQSKRR